ncbi:hypothetical protein BJ322DRAFT_1020252 [Thelephora terrestris]|uniref:Uncharacterized protein n=1 Tax=Thelephora terrestris TaxID=56493 RepID=A0A9P6HG99_9AGAM|nr:hypothetical protein BJ322DRAFT_1020252 [Thelephora terrestris]
MTTSFLPNNAFPLPAPLTPTLLALGVDNRTASTASNLYHSAALTLMAAWEKEYNHACSAIIAASDDRGYSSKELRSKLLTAVITLCTQAVAKLREETIGKAEASLLRRNKKTVFQSKVKCNTIPPPKQSREDTFKLSESAHGLTNVPFGVSSSPHAFPCAYPPPVRPESISFVTHIPLSERMFGYERRAASSNDLDACIDALSRLSLGPPSSQKGSPKPSKTLKSRSHAHATSKTKPKFQLSPSRPRLVSPMLDTSSAVSERSPTKSAPSPPSLIIPPTQNIEIPRSNRRKACSIPYRRPPIHPSASLESQESSYFSRASRTPSLVSDHGSEASSPSTPPDFPSIPIPPTLARKDPFPEALSLEQFLTPYPESGWQDINFGTDLCGSFYAPGGDYTEIRSILHCPHPETCPGVNTLVSLMEVGAPERHYDGCRALPPLIPVISDGDYIWGASSGRILRLEAACINFSLLRASRQIKRLDIPSHGSGDQAGFGAPPPPSNCFKNYTAGKFEGLGGAKRPINSVRRRSQEKGREIGTGKVVVPVAKVSELQGDEAKLVIRSKLPLGRAQFVEEEVVGW